MKEKCRRVEILVHTHAKIKIHFLNPWAHIGQPEKKGTHTSRTQLGKTEGQVEGLVAVARTLQALALLSVWLVGK
ncbi:hypothetical protein EV2_009818 [Malus domestica]